MTIITGTFNPPEGIRMNKTKALSKAGFSLAEVLVALTISTFILASAYAAIISLAKGSESMINYSEMNTQSRMSLEIFGRDARMTKDVYQFTDTTFTAKREIWDDNTNSYVNRFIRYRFVDTAGTFTRSVFTVGYSGGKEVPGTRLSREILLYDVDELKFTYYRLVDPDIANYDPIATKKLEVKHVQLEAKIQRSVLNLANTNYIISARFMMRNKDVSE